MLVELVPVVNPIQRIATKLELPNWHFQPERRLVRIRSSEMNSVKSPPIFPIRSTTNNDFETFKLAQNGRSELVCLT